MKNALPATVRMPIPDRFRDIRERSTIELPVGRLPQPVKKPEVAEGDGRES